MFWKLWNWEIQKWNYWGFLDEGTEKPVIKDMRKFILEILHQWKNYLPHDDEYINKFKVLNPANYDRSMWIFLADKFPNIIDGNKFSQFIEELDSLEVYDFEKVDSITDLYLRWIK